jgi:hypothetical protein
MNQILAGVLVVQVLLAVLLFLRGDDSGIRSLEPLLPSFEPDKVEKITITGGDDKADGEGGDKAAKKAPESVVLARNGDDWVVASSFDYPAETQKVTDLLDKVKGMKSRGPVATGAARQKQLEVGDDSFQRKLVLTAGGKETVLYVGASAGARQTSVRMAGSDAIHGVSGLTAYGVGTNPASWVDTAYFTVEPKDVASVDIANASGSFTLERADDGWKVLVNGTPLVVPADKDLFVDHIDKLVAKVARIHLAEPGDPKRTVDKPQATVTIRMKPPEAPAAQDGGPVTPGASAEPAEDIIDIADGGAAKDRAYVRVKGNETAAMVNALAMSDVVELTRDALLAKKGEGKKEAEAPAGGMPPGGMQGMENLPPDVQQQLMEQMMKNQGQ